jgi:filamentous hemagglutinin family protein
MGSTGYRLRSALLASSSLIAGAGGAVPMASTAFAQNILPTNGLVTSGAASIRQSAANLSVTQTSPRAIVNWGSFSIGPSNGVTFDQPNASSAILNRVTGSTTSTIAGQLKANGQVYLVNPNGIAITKSGAVQVGGGFVASTLGIADNDFNNGNLKFVGKGASAGVSNAGSIAAAPGGFVGLLGGTVANSGVVSVPLGKVAMGSGEQATLNLTGDNFLQVAVPTDTKTADGQALIDVSGKVHAAGGLVQLRAATVAQAIRNAVNVPGALSVTSARASGGSIILGGGSGGDVSVTGRLKASGRNAGGTIAVSGHDVALRQAKLAAASAKGRGGEVTVTGTNAVSLASSLVYASGATGGGAIRIGGDFHGASDLTSAQTTTIDSASTLNASATASGDGGRVAVWSDATTNFAGKITATGGPNGGDGGFVEVSANPATHGVLSYSGFADLTAPKGKTGTLLLDPFDITISGGPDSGGSFSGGVFTPAATSVISTTTLVTQLNGANVVVSTGLADSPGAGEGNLTVSAPITWGSANSLTLEAADGISIDAAIAATGAGSLTLNAPSIGPETGFVSIFAPLSTTTGAITITGGGAPPLGIELGANVTTSGGAITFNNPVQLQAGVTISAGAGTVKFGSTVDNGFSTSCDGACDLTVTASAISFAGASGPLGGTNPLGAVSLTSTNSMTLPSITATTILAQTTGAAADLTLGSGTILTAFGAGTPITLGAGRAFINDSGNGNGTIVFGTEEDPRWVIYSSDPAVDTFGGLNSGNTAVWNTPFGGPVPNATGDFYAFVFQPTITVTSSNLGKTYGSDVTALVAADFTISGLQPGVAGAFNPDTAAAVYSGTPSVTSLGSPARASVAGSPYPITVAPGTFAVTDGYALALDSAGRLTIDPLALTYAVANATSTYGTLATLGAATLTGVLPGDAVAPTVGTFSGTTPVVLAPRTPVGVYSEQVTALSNPNYTIAATGNTPGTLTIDPLALTYAVANATSTYGTLATLGAATLFGVLAGDTVVSTVGAFSGTTPVAIGPRTPAGAYSEQVTALSNSNYTVALSGNTPGTLTIDPLTITFSVADASSIFGTTPILGPATLFGVLPGDVVIPTVDAFLGAAPIALSPFTPVGRYAQLVTAISNPNYRIAPAPNFPGVLTVSAPTANPGAPSDPGFLPGLTQINNPAQTEYDVGGYEQVLPHFTVACNEPPSLPDPNRFSDPDQALRAISQSMENYFRRCQNPTQTTIGDALDAYAAKLQVLAPRLPPALRNVPAIVAEGAKRVRAAASRAEAVAVLRQTVAAVHKEIALVLSDDPQTRGREVRDGDVIAGALGGASVALVNSGSL